MSEAARRDYWASKMDEADRFMATIMRAPVRECGERMVSLAAAAAAAGVDGQPRHIRHPN